jgi:hypothetical protein
MIRVTHASNVRVKGLKSFLNTTAVSMHASDTNQDGLTLVCEELMLIVWVTYCPFEPIKVRVVTHTVPPYKRRRKSSRLAGLCA